MKIELKQLIALLFLIIDSQVVFSQGFGIEYFKYKSTPPFVIDASLYLPHGYLKALVIELESADEDYKFPTFQEKRDSLEYQEILSFLAHGYGVVLISPRYKNTIENLPKRKSQTYTTLADDADSLVQFLRRDIRFKGVPIGVTGVSAMGMASAKLATRQHTVDFALLESVPSTLGVDDFTFKWKTDLKGFPKSIYLALFEDFRGYFYPWTSFTYKGKLYRARRASSLKPVFAECVFQCFSELEREILPYVQNIDSIHTLAKSKIKRDFNTKKITRKKYSVLMFGKDKMVDVNHYLDVFVDIAMLSPADIDHLAWDPEKCYPKIDCPTLMLFGTNDINLDFKRGVANVRRIIDKYNKQNITLQIIPNVDHSFHAPGDWTYYNFDGRKIGFKKISEKKYEAVYDWLDKNVVKNINLKK